MREQNETSYHPTRPWADLALELLCGKLPDFNVAGSPRELPICEKFVLVEKEEEEKLSLHV